MAWVRRGKWAAHAFPDVCPYTTRGCSLKPRPGGPPPWEPAELSMSGMPYGAVCPWCAKHLRNGEAVLRQAIRTAGVSRELRPLWMRATEARTRGPIAEKTLRRSAERDGAMGE